MSDLFRSAFNYFNLSPVCAVPIGKIDHPLVGTNIEVGGLRLKLRSLIAEGGFALVFSAQDSQGNWFALKRQLAADRETADAIIKEIRFLRELTDHPAIIRYVQAAQLNQQESGHGRTEFLLLTELCSGGCVSEVLQRKPFSLSEVLKIFYAACSAVFHMHAKNPSIIHRDMKIENLLFDSCGFVKLCDFGSATTEVFFPNDSWSVQQRQRLEEELARHTTPMYRSPEILDLYSNFPIGPAQDVWALGCILFYLCYRRHPFEDSAKLRIINANYVLPEGDTGYNIFHPLIEQILQVDPRKRPSIVNLCEKLSSLANSLSVDLTKPLDDLQLPQLTSVGQTSASISATTSQLHQELMNIGEKAKNFATSRSSPITQQKIDHEHTAQQQASAMLGALKDQGLSWFKTIKEKTTSVAQTVQSTYGGRGPDITFLTSRLVIAPLIEGVPEPLSTQAEEAMRQHIIERMRNDFAVFNLSQRCLRGNYGKRLNEFPMHQVGSGIAPTVTNILALCSTIGRYLNENNTNVVVLTAQCILLAVSLMLYVRLVPRPLFAIEYICSKRPHSSLPPSYHRQIDLLHTIVSADPEALQQIVHNHPVALHSILISPTPMFNRNRSGCRPVIEIFAEGVKVWSSLKNYEELRSFELAEYPMVDLDLGNIVVDGDVQIIIYHARWIKMQHRVQLHFMFSVGFHSNFIRPNIRMLEFTRGDLDHQFSDDSKFGEPFRVGIRLEINDIDHGFSLVGKLPAFIDFEWNNFSYSILVSDLSECELLMRNLGLSKQERTSPLSQQSNNISNTKCETKSSVESNVSNFFSTLDWTNESISNKADPYSMGNMKKNLPNISDQPLQSHTAEAYERLYGIRVSNIGDDDDSDQYKFDHEKVDNLKPSADKEKNNSASSENIDLLGLGSGDHLSGMQRIVSAPSFMSPSSSQSVFDPFAEFLASTSNDNQESGNRKADLSSSAKTTPKVERRNYSRSHFDAINSIGGPKVKTDNDAFGDLLSSHGFSASSRNVKSIGEMKRENDVKDMDPIAVKIRDWTRGKERNIRALLSSLNDILWPGIDNWEQPSMADLLTPTQVKKYYRKACLVIHPDKQTGTENESLAREIFTELNDAWTSFEASNS